MLFRKATALDVPFILAIIDKHKHIFFDDYTELAPEVTLDSLRAGTLYVFDKDDKVVGCLSLSNQFHDLFAVIHMVIEPSAIRTLLRENLLLHLIDVLFADFKINKLMANVLHTQTCAIKLLQKCFFRLVGRKDMHTRQRGRYMDVIEFELKRKRWKKFKNNKENV